MSLKKTLIYLIVVGLSAISVVSLFTASEEEKRGEIKKTEITNIKTVPYVTIGKTKIEVRVADTSKLRTKGLSGIIFLKENTGMLFVFEKEGIYPFWMKDMNFPIDIIWINNDLRVTDITRNATPESYPRTFSPKKPIKYALEINPQPKTQNYINIGDYVSLNIK